MEKGRPAELHNYQQGVVREKRKAIFTAAQEEFINRGFGAVSIADIANAADVSSATIYKHFQSKEKLFEAVIDLICQQIEIWEADIDDRLPPARQIFEFLRSFFELCEQVGGAGLFRLASSESLSLPHASRRLNDAMHKAGYQTLVNILSRLSEEEHLLRHDCARAARLIIGMIREEIFWPCLFDPSHQTKSRQSDAIVEAIDTCLAYISAGRPAISPQIT